MRKISVRAIIVHQGKQLLVKLKHYNNQEPLDFYCTIGGGLDDGESIVDGLKREIIEETGITPEIGRLLYVHQYFDEGQEIENLEFFFLVNNAADYTKVDLKMSSHGLNEIEEIGFYDSSKLRVLPEFLKDIDVGSLDKPNSVEFLSYI